MKWVYSRSHTAERRLSGLEDRYKESIQNTAQRGGIYKKRRKFISKVIRRYNFRKQERLGISKLKILFKKLDKEKHSKHEESKKKEIIKIKKQKIMK